jgi:hypothetical protein
MQVKTIEKIIEAKIDNWIESIQDENLKKKLKRQVLVSGGSICSMFLKEKVNDFDVYLKDMDVLIELVQYYTKDFGGSTEANRAPIYIMDGREKAKYAAMYGGEENFSEFVNSFTICVKNLKPDQVKLFFNNEKGGIRANENATDEEKLKYIPVFFSPNAISLSNDIQIVTRFHGTAEEIHKTFDFVHATNYWTKDEGLVTNKQALESILTKQLKYQGSLYPVTSIIRMKKFIKRGWNISAGEILKMILNCGDYDLKNPDVLEDQLIGVDVAYFSTLIKALRSVDHEKFHFGYLSAIIDKVFEQADDSPMDE